MNFPIDIMVLQSWLAAFETIIKVPSRIVFRVHGFIFASKNNIGVASHPLRPFSIASRANAPVAQPSNVAS
jgi:hypothetical protein